MKRNLLALVCALLCALGCGKSDESLCESVASQCSDDAVDGLRKLCLQTLDSKSCGDAARDYYECVDDAELACIGSLPQTKNNECLTELAAYVECTSTDNK